MVAVQLAWKPRFVNACGGSRRQRGDGLPDVRSGNPHPHLILALVLTDGSMATAHLTCAQAEAGTDARVLRREYRALTTAECYYINRRAKASADGALCGFE